jgi:hypothetical protein
MRRSRMQSSKAPLAIVTGLALGLVGCGEDFSFFVDGGPDGAPADAAVPEPDAADPGADADSPSDATASDASVVSPPVDAAYDGDLDAPAEAGDGDVEQAPVESAILCYDGAVELYRTVNIEACDCAECAERASTTFTLGARSRVLQVTTYARSGGGEFGYTITAPDGTAITSGTMAVTSCHPTMPWCFYGDETNEILDPGAYTLAIDWPHICSNPTSGGQGFVIVSGCSGS